MTNLRVLEAEPPGADVIERLRDVLTEAEAGNVSSVAIAVVYRDGCTGALWSSPPSLALLIGAVTRLSLLLTRKLDA